MGRVLIATQSWGVIQDSAGNARRAIMVGLGGTDPLPRLETLAGSAPTIYVNETGPDELEPLTDRLGAIPGWIEEGSYNWVDENGVKRVEAVRSAGYDAYKALAASPETLTLSAAVYDALTGALLSATVTWPDGTTGTFTGTPSADLPGALDGWTITYGSPVIRTYTQPTVTRNSSGDVTARPAVTVT